jgi:hypothetical protein
MKFSTFVQFLAIAIFIITAAAGTSPEQIVLQDAEPAPPIDVADTACAGTDKIFKDRSTFDLARNCSFQLAEDTVLRYQAAFKHTEGAHQDIYIDNLHAQKLVAINAYATRYNDGYFAKFTEPGVVGLS